MQPRIIFAGTPAFAASHLEALIDHGVIPIAVYTQPDRPSGRGRTSRASPVKHIAVKHQIDCYQPESLKSAQEEHLLAELKPDLMIVVAYGLLLPQAVLDIPAKGCINVHASLLPRWRGAAPIQRAIEAGDNETGVTIMQMDIGLDTGDMLHKKSIVINAQDTSASLHDALATTGAEALLEVLPRILDGTVIAEPQPDDGITYAHKLTKAEGIIDWSESATVIDQKIRAFTPWPGAQTNIADKRIKLSASLGNQDTQAGEPGTILAHNGAGLVVACGEGTVIIDQLQFPGKRLTATKDLLNSQAQTLAIGQRFY
jgi:methionyl-tRNA formyltransferase